MPAMAMLDGVVKLYGTQPALGPVTLEIPGGTVGLLGPNGAGKSTLNRLLLGLIPPTSGTVTVLEEEVHAGSRGLRQRIGYFPEGPASFPGLSGAEAVAYAGRLSGMPKGDAIQRAHQVLDYVELREERYRGVGTYSTGMRQRLKLAASLVHDPELLILDEPTEGVDPEGRTHLLELIRELAREHGLQILISTHLLHDVEEIAGHAIVLNRGRVAAAGTLDELRAAPSRGFLVRVKGDAAPLRERLTEAGVAWQLADPNLRIDVDDPREVLRLVKEAGLVVRHLAPIEVSLSEAFDQALGGGDADA